MSCPAPVTAPVRRLPEPTCPCLVGPDSSWNGTFQFRHFCSNPPGLLMSFRESQGPPPHPPPISSLPSLPAGAPPLSCCSRTCHGLRSSCPSPSGPCSALVSAHTAPSPRSSLRPPCFTLQPPSSSHPPGALAPPASTTISLFVVITKL